MRLNISTLYTRHQPSACDLRVFLDQHGVQPAPSGPYEDVLRKLGMRHEKDHLATLPGCVDLSTGSPQARLQLTEQELQRHAAPLYQPVLLANATDVGADVELLGIPDFLIPTDAGWAVRDCKLSLHAEEDTHPEIPLQLQALGFLFRLATGTRPVGLEVVLGNGNITQIEYDEDAAIGALKHLAALASLPDELYEPVGWSKCAQCGYRERCWPRAVQGHDVALVADVDVNLAKQLQSRGVSTYDELLQHHTVASLAEVKRKHGARMERVGKRADRILAHADAMITGKVKWLGPISIPQADSYAVLDLEGLPAQFSELDRVFLWGMRVYGAKPSPYHSALAGFGPDGDRAGWDRFLEVAGEILAEHGDIRFVHFANYEAVRLDEYIERYGDPNGVGGRVRRLLFDLLPAMKKTVVLPLPSYSLKVVEQFVGFARKLAEGRGDWAMSRFIEASETNDPGERESIMNEVLLYNSEDLDATWAVMCWLRENVPVG